MLKSRDLKLDALEIQEQIKALVEQGAEVPAELTAQYNATKADYQAALADEAKARKTNSIKEDDKMDKKNFNVVLKALLTKKSVEPELVAQSGIVGIVDTVGTVGSIESVGTRGGYLVPEEYLDLDAYGKDLVKVPARRISVNLPKGHIPMVDLSQAKDGAFLAKHDELDTIGQKNPVFSKVDYACETYTGIVPISMDLMEDTSDIMPVVSECFALTSAAQENKEILAALAGISSPKTEAIGSGKTFADKEAITAIRKAILKDLSGVNRSKAQIVVCDTTFAKLACIEDGHGHPYLCQDVTNPSVYRLEGHEVVAVDDAFMTAEDTLTEVAWVGNFDRVAVIERKGLEVSSDASNMFNLDAVAVKGKKRFDVQVLEKGAFVKVS